MRPVMPACSSAVLALSLALSACSKAPAPAAPDTNADDVAQIREFLANVERIFDAGDLDAAVAVFTDDAMILSQGFPDAVGKDAIRALYAGALATANLRARFHTDEIELYDGIAYERGTYDLTITDKATGRELSKVTNRHVHILKQQPDGEWKTWRMFTNSAEPSPPAAETDAR